MVNDQQLEEILIHRQVITPEQVAAVQALRGSSSAGLMEALVKIGVSEDRCYMELAAHFFLSYRDPSRSMADVDAVARLKVGYLQENQLFPLPKENGVLPVVIADLAALGRVDEVGLILGCPVQPILTTPPRLAQAMSRLGRSAAEGVQSTMDGLATPEESQEESKTENVADLVNEAPVIKLVNLIILRGVNDGASDIHLEPYETDLVVRYRIDGELREGPRPPPRYRLAIISRLKIMAHLDIAERRLPQDGRIKIRAMDREYDIRFSTLPGLYGESVVMRILDQSRILYQIEEIGMGSATLTDFKKLLSLENGAILVTGPTGSGKTSTLYAALHRLNTKDVKIITVEDPVEYRLKGIVQIQANSAIGLTFASALRSILRQDPDIVMVGEIRDLETAQIAVQAALTGHQVFSTLHTNDAPTAMTRLLDLGVPGYLIASVVRGVIAQRLARRICAECKEPYQPDARELADLFSEEVGRTVQTLYRGRGCEECHQVGYRGRLGLYELMIPDDVVRELVLKSASSAEIRKAAMARGLVTLQKDGVAKVLAGETTIREILRATQGEL